MSVSKDRQHNDQKKNVKNVPQHSMQTTEIRALKTGGESSWSGKVPIPVSHGSGNVDI